MEGKINVMLVEDHTIVRQGLYDMLKKVDWLHIIAEASSGQEMIDKYFDNKPDIVISDIEMPGMKGLDAANHILKNDKSAKIVFLTMYNTEEYVFRAYKMGAGGIISKSVSFDELIRAISLVAKGEKYFLNRTPSELKKIIDKYTHQKEYESGEKPLPLTSRQMLILKYISAGLKSEEIADKLSISKKTIDAERSKMMQTLQIKSPLQLMKYALQMEFDSGKEEKKE